MILSGFANYFGIIEIILAIVLAILVLMQTKGADLGSFMGGGGGDGGSFRTRRGVEATMHNVTKIVAALFFLNTLFTFIAYGQMV